VNIEVVFFLLLGAILSTFAISLYSQLRLSRKLAHLLMEKYEELDSNMAAAIQLIVEKATEIDIEPPNPMQAMFMQLFQDRIAQNSRNSQGQFISDTFSEDNS
tara:strand:- start:108 stop:416 length:309 start_codon:yes stop_codon:yes gene_type:complete